MSSRVGLSSGVRSGFTLVELLTCVGMVGALGGLVALAQSPAAQSPAQAPGASPASGRDVVLIRAKAGARASERQMKCSSQIREAVQGLLVWAANNDSRYPTPSLLDIKNSTVAETGQAKDTTANILSLLIYNGLTSTESTICPDEASPNIQRDRDYQYTDPVAAKVPKEALWDPAFNADFTKPGGNNSYAHLQPSGDASVRPEDKNSGAMGRLAAWRGTFSSSEAVFADRGPRIERVERVQDQPNSYEPKFNASTTLSIHGGLKTWEGNVGFNDGGVSFFTSLLPKQYTTYKTKGGETRPDLYHFDEPDDPKARNLFLGVFLKAGQNPGDFAPIWD
ncbi:MAG: hypothetical protein K2Q20_02850 [Phycisphaerales bacterium]|nr:hypothetical protein [Phycisphaerales bacterium]